MRRFFYLLYICLPTLLLSQPTAPTLPALPTVLGNVGCPEGAPVLSSDGRTLLFVRDDCPYNQGVTDQADVWLIHRTATGWSRPINAGSPINSPLADEVIGMAAGGEWIAILRRTSQPQIDILSPEGRQWVSTYSLPFPVSLSPARLGGVYLDSRGRNLVFAAIMPGGYGGFDLYHCVRENDNTWSNPQHLGPQVNSVHQENQPYLAADQTTLYFSSDRPGGAGGLDIWRTARASESVWVQWANPLNLRDLNTNKDEIAVSLALGGDQAVVGTSDGKLHLQALSTSLQPQPVSLVRGQCSLPDGQALANQVVNVIWPDGVQEVRLDAEGNYCLAVPDDSYPLLDLVRPGYYAPGLPLNAQELPRDIEPGFEAAQARLSDDYRTRNAELHRLRLSIDQNYDDLHSLQRRRTEYQQQLRATDLTAQWNYSDPKLDELRTRYQQWLQSSDSSVVVAPGALGLVTPLPLPDKILFAELVQRARTALTHRLLLPVGMELAQEAFAAANGRGDLQSQPVLGQVRSSLEPAPSRVYGPLSARQQAWLDEISNLLTNPLRTYLQAWLRPIMREAVLTETAHQRIVQVAQTSERELNQLMQQQLQEEEKLNLSAQPTAIAAPVGKPNQGTAINMQVMPVRPGQRTRLPALQFVPNSAELMPIAYAELERLTQLLLNYPQLRLAIHAHASDRVSHRLANQLTTARVAVILDYLSVTGIDSHRLEGRPRGKQLNAGLPTGSAGGRAGIEIEVLAVGG